MEFCVNKDKPEMQCDGKCHLAKKLETEPSYTVEVNKRSKKVPVPQEKLRIQEEVLFITDFSLELPKSPPFFSKPGDFYQALFSDKHIAQIEHPPTAII